MAKYEDQVLDAIARTPHGALLFLSDPGRFLTEAGFVVGQGLQAELNDLAEGELSWPLRGHPRRQGPGSYLAGVDQIARAEVRQA